MDFGPEGETVGFVRDMDRLDDAIRMMTAMLNRFNHSDVYIGVDSSGKIIGIDACDDTVKVILERMESKVNHLPDVNVDVCSEDGRQYVHIHAEGYETPYSFGSWFYVRRYHFTDDKRIEWSENLTCGMKRHRRITNSGTSDIKSTIVDYFKMYIYTLNQISHSWQAMPHVQF